MALSIPSAQGAEQGNPEPEARGWEENTEKSRRGYPVAASLRSFAGFFSVITGSLARFPFYSVFFSLLPLLLYLGVKEPALRQRRADWSPLVHVIRD